MNKLLAVVMFSLMTGSASAQALIPQPVQEPDLVVKMSAKEIRALGELLNIAVGACKLQCAEAAVVLKKKLEGAKPDKPAEPKKE